MSGPLPIELILKLYVQFKRGECVHSPCYCSAAPFERYLHQSKNVASEQTINQQESILAYKVINGTYLLNDFFNHGDVGHQIQLRNGGDLRIPLYAATQSQLFVRCIEPSKRGMAYQVT